MVFGRLLLGSLLAAPSILSAEPARPRTLADFQALAKAGELQKHFAERRAAVAEKLKDGLIVLSGGRMVQRNDDVSYPFRQKSDILYLSGVEEPDHRVLIDGPTGRQILFLPRPSQRQVVWNRHFPTLEEAKTLYGFSETAYNDELPTKLIELVQDRPVVHLDQASADLFGWLLDGTGVPVKKEDLRQALDAVRTVKMKLEIELIKIANDISSLAQVLLMENVRPDQAEYEVQAAYEAALKSAGLEHTTFPTIVASGRNASILHYEDNGYPVMGQSSDLVKNGELILVDAGGELMGYGADITRTFPAGERFTDKQKEIYAAVLTAQNAVIDYARPGLTIKDLNDYTARILINSLRDLGILKGDAAALFDSKAIKVFMPHGVSHRLGLDVHDVSSQRKEPLSVGDVITVEPGIYFNRALLGSSVIRSKYKDQIDFALAEAYCEVGGVRIEDDIAIQDGPAWNLTIAPKDIDAVEALRSKLGPRS